MLLCLACRKTSLWVLSEAARPDELGGSLHLTVNENTLYGEDSAGLRKCLHQFEVARLGPLISHYPAEKTNLRWNSQAG